MAGRLVPAGLQVPVAGRYIADHLAASRVLAALAWREARDEAFLAGTSRALEHALYDAGLNIAKAEAAAGLASQLRITRAFVEEADARRLVDSKVGELASARIAVEAASAALAPWGDDPYGERTGEPFRRGPPPPDGPPTGAETVTRQTVLDLLDQLLQVLKKLEELEEIFEDEEEKDAVAKAIAKVAGFIVSGGKAAIIGAVAELLDALDIDAEPEDVDVEPTPDGGVSIYLKMKRTCFLIFDLDPDYVYYRKGGKAGTVFKKGQPAKEKYRQDEAKKAILDDPSPQPPSAPPPKPPSATPPPKPPASTQPSPGPDEPS